MEKTMQLFCSKEEILDRIQNCFGTLKFTINGENKDYTLYFPEVSEEQSEGLFEVFCDECYGDGEMSLAENLVALLDECGINIATAESCTGGMVAASIVDVSGCSNVFYEGLVTYSNNAKIKRLNVSEETLQECGAVSAETAIEMANGLLVNNVAIAISTTGIAGPTGGTIEKPVGLVYIAAVSEHHTDVYRSIFRGDRMAVRTQAKNSALFYALKHIKNYY